MRGIANEQFQANPQGHNGLSKVSIHTLNYVRLPSNILIPKTDVLIKLPLILSVISQLIIEDYQIFFIT